MSSWAALARAIAHVAEVLPSADAPIDAERRRLLAASRAATPHALRDAPCAIPERSGAADAQRVRLTTILHTALALDNGTPAASSATQSIALRSIAAVLTDLAEPMPWFYHYEPQPGEADLGERIAFAELIGPDGLLAAPDCRIGFTLVDADTLYPLHAHPAVELYLVISGHAQWQTATSRRIVPPGEWVLHRSNEAHAMRTFAEPLLALWHWSGDLNTPAFYLPHGAPAGTGVPT